ncbi:MAG: 4-hydroxybenzoate octaprenyltransferase [Magnetococcales bacterium]|nr:4-hydroxybenzoate octaprenyltransferase [Magnetococcales bacterium]MBF0322066.1 4-hydroxybenzoate octaprenyltransferase [Magnetococcales bacterium]
MKRSMVLLREMLLLMRVDKPIGTWLLLWPSWWALTAAAPHDPDGFLYLIFGVGTFLMRSAGCVANDLADRNFDPHVERTRERPLAARRIGIWPARLLLLVLLLGAFALVQLLNTLTIQLSFVGAGLALFYPYTKRFMHLPQFVMGAAFGWGVIMGWAAASNATPLAAWLTFAATLTWAAGYDTIYAMLDREDDRKIGVKSTAILFGRHDRLAVALLYGITLLLLLWVGQSLHLGFFFHTALLAALGHMSWQLYTLREYHRPKVFRAFLSNRWTGLIILAGFALG